MTATAKMSKEQLKEKLDALQCHFTWKLGIDSFNPPHILQKLDVDIKHATHQNQVGLLGLQAYLYQLHNQSTEALQSLRAAEEHNNKKEQPASTAGSLIIYGNYAWIYYLQASYQEAESYLARVQQLCPAPWDVRLIPEMQAQKGWSLLAVRTRNGERARECFNMALMLEPENRSFRTGLGMAFFSSWVSFWHPDLASEAIIQLERIVHEQPDNYRAKICLARLLQRIDEEKSVGLIEECLEKSSDPEVLKSSALFWMSRSTKRAAEILQQAMEKDPGYHLLHEALAKCYNQQWLNAKQKDRNKVLDAAIKDLQQIVQKYPDHDLTLVKLRLAKFIGERHPAQEKQIYEELQEKIDTLSLRGRQALNLHWGKFFLHREKSPDRAQAKFMEGYSIHVQTQQRMECGRSLKQLTRIYHRMGDFDAIDTILCFLQEANQHLPVKLPALSFDDEDSPSPSPSSVLHGFFQG